MLSVHVCEKSKKIKCYTDFGVNCYFKGQLNGMSIHTYHVKNLFSQNVYFM